jgi:serine protease AprX
MVKRTHQPMTTLVAALRLAALASVWLAVAVPAGAQHRARLSADLADHLAAGSQSIDVIVHGTPAEVDALAVRYNLRVKRYLRSGGVLNVNAGQLAALQQDDAVDHLSGDTRIRASAVDVTAESIGADQVWAGADDRRPLTGKGVTVAVIDTGMDLGHAALAGRVVATEDFTGGDGIDRFGHGTHVAALIAGAPGVTPDTREFRGIAYDARLVNLRALGDDGSGSVSDVVEAIDWAIEHRHEYDIRVINLSLGTPVLQPYRDDPLCEAVARATAAGLVVVVAAGNHGRTASGQTVLGSITSPGNSPYALTVGALDTHGTPQRSDDTVAPYSSRGPTRYDLIIKPDLVAPGSHVVSAEAQGSFFARTYPDHHVAGSGASGYLQLSGTSMAAAVTSGAVALLLEGQRSARPAMVKSILEYSASLEPVEGLLGAGAGSLNIIAATEKDSTRLDDVRANSTVIGDEAVFAGGVVITAAGLADSTLGPTATIASGRVSSVQVANATIVWGQFGGATIIWGQSINPASAINTIIWGQTAVPQTLASSDVSTIIWGQASSETIIWGQASSETIIWGQASSETIIWGQSALPGNALGLGQEVVQ